MGAIKFLCLLIVGAITSPQTDLSWLIIITLASIKHCLACMICREKLAGIDEGDVTAVVSGVVTSSISLG